MRSIAGEHVRDSADAALAERAWARVGDVYFQAERYDEAKRAYTGLLEHFGGSPAAGIASLRLAQCEYNAGRDAAALEGFSRTIEKYPNTAFAREAARGTELALYRLTQRPDGAKVLARLVEQYPSSPFAADALFQIARRAYQEKRYTEAADGFRQVVSRFPGYSAADQAQFLLADAYAQAKAASDARQAYEQFLAFLPQSELAPTVHFRLGLMAAAQEYLQAAVDFTSALDDSAAKDVRSAARYNLALCHRLLGQTDEARVELEKHRAEFPNDERAADVAFQLGDLEELAGHADLAAKEYDRALASRPRATLAVEAAFRLGRSASSSATRTARCVPSARGGVDDRDQPFGCPRSRGSRRSTKRGARSREPSRRIATSCRTRRTRSWWLLPPAVCPSSKPARVGGKHHPKPRRDRDVREFRLDRRHAGESRHDRDPGLQRDQSGVRVRAPGVLLAAARQSRTDSERCARQGAQWSHQGSGVDLLVDSASGRTCRGAGHPEPHLPAEVSEEKLQIALSEQRMLLERNLGVLGTMGNTAPLIGLLGTVWGIMRAFHDMARTGSAGRRRSSAGIAEALFTTAAGLVVAVPAVMLYNHFMRRTAVMMTVTENQARSLRISLQESSGNANATMKAA
jgi:biopolymer transport protein ExbB/TolQ/TolA-binding protein